MKPLVHIVDDDASQRDSMRLLLESMDLETAFYASAREFLDAPMTVQPGCILLDLRMPQMSGLEMQQLLNKRDQPKMPIIFFSAYADVEVTLCAMHQGAMEFLLKPVRDELLLEKIREAVQRDEKQRAEYYRCRTVRARIALLSPRERQIFEGVCEGLSNKDIARQLSISHKTVELHRSNMMSKMHAASLAALVRMKITSETS